MKFLVCYYSRTGITRKACERLAGFLREKPGVEVTLEEIVDTQDRSGAVGYVLSGKDALLKKETKIADFSARPEAFDLVVIGGPVWAFTIPPALRAFATRYAGSVKKAAFIFTQGGNGAGRAGAELSRLLKLEPAASLVLIDKRVAKDAQAEYLDPLREFAGKL